MLNVLAPSVVKPPCASRTAWKTRTITPNTEAAGTPNKIAARPVPVIWLQLPVTEGILSEEITKINAPDIASSKTDLRRCCIRCRIEMTPAVKNGRHNAPHATQSAGGRYPSMICIADAFWGTQNTRPATTEKDRSFFSNAVMFIPPSVKNKITFLKI